MTGASQRITLLGQGLKEKEKEKRGKGRVKRCANWRQLQWMPSLLVARRVTLLVQSRFFIEIISDS